MILEYLWIKEFRVLKDIGFSFSSEKKFHYESDKKKLTVEQNISYIPDFFGSHLSEVTAIIGENGVGKTTLFEFMLTILPQMLQQDVNTNKEEKLEFIFIFSGYIITTDITLISNQDFFAKNGYETVVYKDVHSNKKVVEEFSKINYIFYSNVFDYKKEYKSSNRLIDLSTNFLLIEDSWIDEEKINIENFVYTEIKRQIDYLSEENFVPPFKLPKFLYIRIPENVYKYKLKIDNNILISSGLKNIAEIAYIKNPEKHHQNFKFQIYYNLIKYRGYNNPSLYKDISSELLLNLFTKNFAELGNLNPEQKIEYEKIKDVIDNYDSLLEAQRLSSQKSSDFVFLRYKISEDNYLFYRFMNSLNSLMKIDYFISFSWYNLSSGEKAFLTMLARLNQARIILDEKDVSEKGQVLIFIDEFDLYMHPEWQRIFFSVIQSQLPNLIKEMNMQLILSSHSPFIVSDLPKCNINFLKQKGNITINCDPEKMEDTFGQNIHTLFTNSFFLHDGLLGEFASQKINQLIKYTKGEASNIKSDEEAQKIIDIIGEPIVKNKLQLFLNSKRGDEMTIEWHTKQIEKLKATTQKNIR